MANSSFRRAFSVVIMFALILPGQGAEAWGLKTHAWIADQVLQDAEDGKLTIGGIEIELRDDIREALNQQPQAFIAGSLGPDLFPDVVVGQTTTHPGIEGGWQTDDFLRQVLNGATSPEELAFAYGFATHAAGDIFAHTYVNIYAGDIFELKDERTVEYRHFVLEKYIDHHLPPFLHPDIWKNFDVPASFVRDRLIYNGDVAEQNMKAKTGIHLAALNGARNAVGEASRQAGAIVDRANAIADSYLKQHAALQIQVNAAVAALKLLEISLKKEEAKLERQRQITRAKKAAFDQAADEFESWGRKLAQAEKDYALWEMRQKEGPGKIKEYQEEQRKAQEALDKLTKPPHCNVWPDAEDCKAYEAASNKVKKWEGEVAEWQGYVDQAPAMLHNLHADIVLFGSNKLVAEGIRAQAEFEYNVEKANLDVQQAVVDRAKEQVRQAKADLAKLNDELTQVDIVVKTVTRFRDEFDLLTGVIAEWHDGITNAGQAYIRASQEAGLRMITEDPDKDALEPYQDWLKCWVPVIKGVPQDVAEPICRVRHNVKKLKEDLDRARRDLLPELRVLLFPIQELEDYVKEVAEPEAWKAGGILAGQITNDPQFGQLVVLLANPDYATRDELNRAYYGSSNMSGKDLLAFADVAALIDRDIGLEDGEINLQTFNALKYSIVLAKLALLTPEDLNTLFTKLAGDESTIYGDTLYDPYAGNFTLLLDAVRSIDGNHQWQRKPLPYPRATSPAEWTYDAYGYSHLEGKGLRLFQDPTARKEVFLNLFPDPMIGAIGDLARLKRDAYPFETCERNPFPVTEDLSGQPFEPDWHCLHPLNPYRWFLYLDHYSNQKRKPDNSRDRK